MVTGCEDCANEETPVIFVFMRDSQIDVSRIDSVIFLIVMRSNGCTIYDTTCRIANANLDEFVKHDTRTFSYDITDTADDAR